MVEGMGSIKARDGRVGCCRAVGGGEAVSVPRLRVLLDRRNEIVDHSADRCTDGFTPGSGQHIGIMVVGSAWPEAFKLAEDCVENRSRRRSEPHLQTLRMRAVMM